jgi:hypothetical protein
MAGERIEEASEMSDQPTGNSSRHPIIPSSRQPTRARNHRWVWFFVILAVLAVAAPTSLLVYNLSRQLKPEQLARARELWRKNRPRDYTLEYTKQGNIPTETVVVGVRDGTVESAVRKQAVVRNGRSEVVPLPLEERLYDRYDMGGLFNDIERFLKMDAEPDSPRAFNRATFDPEDGHLINYVRSVSETGMRLEINVELRVPQRPGKGD